MKRLRLLLAALALFLALPLHAAGPGPIRVLHLGQDGTDAPKHCHVLMRDLGRDAIWFDYTSDPAVATPDWVARFDVVLLDAPADAFPAVAAGQPGAARVVPVDFWTNDKASVEAAREKVLAKAGPARRQQWEAFLAQREPERREPNPNIANYERRPEAVTFQQPFTVKGSTERIQIAPDLRLQLFASEPDIAKPIAFSWDERGRLWVCETRDYPHDVQPAGEGRDTIKICEDTDGDGRADKFSIFADRLNIPTSLVFANGGIIVSQPPRFLFLADTNGDDKADVRREIMTGWGIGDTHAQANNLHYGHDNWLYGCVGYSGYSGEVGGKSQRFGQGTFRFKADGSALEFLHQFSNNSWGHSANDAGDQFGGTANGAPIFYGGLPASIVPNGLRAMTAKKINVEDKCHTITPHFRQVDVFGGYTAAAGSAFIYSANLPTRLQGKAMVCEPTMKVIALMDVQPRGAGYTARDGFNLVASSDEWMSPIFSEVGPDGAVWFADWQNFIIQHNPTPSVDRGGYAARTGPGGAHVNPLRDHARGRIYRVTWEKAARPAPAPLHRASERQLVDALGHDTLQWRLTAQRLLVEGRRTGAVPALRQAATNNAAPVAALHALWTLHGLGQLDDTTHRTALLAGDARLRRAATRALPADRRGESLFFSAAVVSDPDPITRCSAFVKLAEFETRKEIQDMVAGLARNPSLKSDEWLNETARVLVRRHKVQAYKEGPNLLPNPGFETAGPDGLPEGWTRRDYGNRPANREARWEIVRVPGQARSGSAALRGASSAGEADTSLHADVPLKPNTQYRLSGWIKGQRVRGKLSLNDHIGRAETDTVRREADWTEVEAVFNSGSRDKASINILLVASGQGYWDDVKLCELLPNEEPAPQALAGDIGRGRQIFYEHTARCVLCHMVNQEGSTVGPALDGLASRTTPQYRRESLLEPSKVLAKGFENLSLSPMPPMGDIFNPQQIEDILAYLQTLK